MNLFNSSIVCCYLHPISKYGYPPPPQGTEKYLQEMKELGFQNVELEGIRREHLLDMYEMRFQIKDKVEQLGLSVPYFCVVLPGLSSPHEMERAKNLGLFEMGCEIAEVLCAKGVLDNGPLPPYRFPYETPFIRHFDEDVLKSATFPSELHWQKYWQELIETYQAACDIAALWNLTYQIHPCSGVLAATTDAFLYFQDAVGRQNLRFNFDTANQYYLKDNLALSLHRLADYVDYIHISDNSGLKVEHLVPGDGAIDWDIFFETLDLIGFRGHIGIDIGGAESDIRDLDEAYINAAKWLEATWKK